MTDKIFIPADYVPILIQSLVAFGFVALTMFATHFISSKRKKNQDLKKG